MRQSLFRFSLCLVVSMMSFIHVWADGPEMNKVYTVPMTPLPYWDRKQIPSSAFLDDATSVVIEVKYAHYVIFKYVDSSWNTTDLNSCTYLNDPTTFTYEAEGNYLNYAKAGQLYIHSDGAEGIEVTVLNKDASYQEPDTPGGDGGNGGGSTDPDYTPDYTNQLDSDGDGKLEPNADNPAFGALVDYKKYPQLTDIPSMYITVYKTDDQGVTYDPSQTMDISTTKNDWYYQCRIVIADKYGKMKQRDELVKLRGRGNSTWTWVQSGKRAFRLKFPEKTKLLVNYDMNKQAEDNGDYADAKSWTLLANAFDKTLIHNAFTYELGKNKLTNLPFCPAYRFVDLFVNNVYYGTYQVSDQVQVDKKRVNVNSDSGWFLELTASNGNKFLEEPYITVNGGPLYANVKNPEDVVSRTETFNAMSDYLTTMYKKLASSNSTEIDFSYKTGYRTLIDVKSLIDWFIGEEISANYDGTYGNIYAYREAENDKLHFGPMWDLDIAYGGYEGAAMAEKHIWDSPNHAYEGVSNMLRTLWSDKYFVRDLYTRWQEIYNKGELKTFCTEKIEMLAGIVAQSQEKNYTIAKPFGATSTLGINQADNMGGSFESYEAAIIYFKNYVTARIGWLNDEITQRYSDLECATHNPCDEFGHQYDTYLVQENGSYKKGCSICNTAIDPVDTKTYYLFTIYPESKKATTQYATSWEPSQDKPNSIAVVEATKDVVERIEGYNIIAGKKTLFPDGEKYLTCKDFRLTDGHPYYSENKFVATNATYSRSISNEWGTIILPYKFQKASTEFADFFHLSEAKEGTLVFTPIQPDIDGNASAYTPVVFKAKDTSKGLVVNGTNITVKKSDADKTNSTVDGWTLVGTVEKTVFDNVNSATELLGSSLLYYISNNQFWRATGKYTNNPFRAYFLNSSSTQAAASFRLACDEDATGIANPIAEGKNVAVFVEQGGVTLVSSEDKSVNVHSISGALVSKTTLKANIPTTINLPSGIYTVNGVKVNIR